MEVAADLSASLWDANVATVSAAMRVLATHAAITSLGMLGICAGVQITSSSCHANLAMVANVQCRLSYTIAALLPFAIIAEYH